MRLKRLLPFIFLILIPAAMAHCPLCTMGAAVAAGGAAWLGVGQAAIGVFMGAFAISMGLWFGRVIKKRFNIRYLDIVLAVISYVTTIFPLLIIMKDFRPVSIFITGDYGSLLNSTYLVNLFVTGSLIGAAIMFITPTLSKKISELREGRMIPYQGIALTFFLLIVSGAILEIIIR